MRNRLWQMLLGWGFVGVVYQFASYLQGTGDILPPGYIDELIPFSANGIWCYLSFFIIIPLAYLTCPVERLRWLRYTMQLTALIAGIVYLWWPTTMLYPLFTPHTLSERLLALLARIDQAQNCLPSLHMALTLLAVSALYRRNMPLKSAGYLLWCVAIGFSILQLRRHLFIDLLSGAALAGMVGTLLQKSSSLSWSGNKERLHD
jgi:membrane-associated phospholipid phosphatase